MSLSRYSTNHITPHSTCTYKCLYRPRENNSFLILFIQTKLILFLHSLYSSSVLTSNSSFKSKWAIPQVWNNFLLKFSLWFIYKGHSSKSWLIDSIWLHWHLLLSTTLVFIEDTGQPRYLKVKGNVKNTLSYPKFDISKMWRHPNMMYMFNFSKTYFAVHVKSICYHWKPHWKEDKRNSF